MRSLEEVSHWERVRGFVNIALLFPCFLLPDIRDKGPVTMPLPCHDELYFFELQINNCQTSGSCFVSVFGHSKKKSDESIYFFLILSVLVSSVFRQLAAFLGSATTSLITEVCPTYTSYTTQQSVRVWACIYPPLSNLHFYSRCSLLSNVLKKVLVESQCHCWKEHVVSV